MVHVLIAGAGIGGFCLAQGLRKRGISCTVFEREPGIARAGYRLQINAAGGGALEECLPGPLYELYMQTSSVTPRRHVAVQLDEQGREVGTRPFIGPPNDSERPHTAVNRHTLRQIMASGLEEIVRFDRKVTGFEADDHGVRLCFDDGSSETGDILVAADGINSVIRRQLLPDVPVMDTGIRCLHARVYLTDPQWLRGLSPPLPSALAYDKPLCASLDGFTLHAATRAGAHHAAAREALLRVGLRPPIAEERIGPANAFRKVKILGAVPDSCSPIVRAR